ncbi:Na+/H+ antiporter NhaC [Pseudohongiella sp.]|uniref:Na+/H+ antiporter NhaC-like C-terminal domain-containing protein n=1 Tax=marine sediment metagenome TaxID=412755 RepID=A0A0F9XIT2_9ZZZZ|nr:Na+/H+ antiporter NhaC [Pseudohongiella sp.]
MQTEPGTLPATAKRPSAAHGALCFAGNLAIIALGLFALGISLHILLFACLIWTGLNSRLLGHDFVAIRDMMNDGISRALPAIYIFLLIGLVIAAFMQSGTVAALIYYGLNLLSPAWFLAAGLVLCSVMSVATGTSWGTAGTLGVVLIGIGGAMGIPLPMVAGMIVCGATFGDKLSPVSDTTNLAAMSAGTSLFRHIGSMLYTTVPAFVISLLVFVVLGLAYADNALPTVAIAEIRQALTSSYGLNLWITLLPLLVMLTLSLRRFPAEVAMTASVVVAVLIAILYQGQSVVTVLNNLWSNQAGTTGITSLDELLGRGGMLSMSWTLLLSLMALALGGMLFAAGFLQAMLQGLIARLKSTASLVASTIGAGIIGNMGMGEAYITIILNSQLFRPAFEAKGIDNAVLSRSVEEGATMSTGLIPWTTAGAFYAATLGVPVLDYLPYAFLNYLNPLIAITMAALGLGLLRRVKKN